MRCRCSHFPCFVGVFVVQLAIFSTFDSYIYSTTSSSQIIHGPTSNSQRTNFYSERGYFVVCAKNGETVLRRWMNM